MKTSPSNYYDLMTFGLGNTKFQTFIDKFQLKYNDTQTDGFSWDPEIQLDYTYEQLIASLNIATLPIYVDEASEALDKSLNGFQIGSNKIPTQKHRYGLNTRMLRERMLMVQKFGQSALNGETQNALLEMLFESTDKLIAGNRNALTHQRMQIVSTGQFTISTANNPRGITGLTFDFGVPAANKDNISATTAAWWTNVSHVAANEGSAADPLGYMKNLVKANKKNGFPRGHIEMAEDLFDDLLTHTAVLEKVGYAQYPAASSASVALKYAQNLTDDALKSVIERIVGCPIKTYDTLAATETFDTTTKSIKPVTVENFKATNIAFVPDGQIGTIKAVRPLVFDDPTARYAWFDGGRTLISNRYDSKTRAMYVESEMAVLCVPNMPQYMGVYTVTV